jgi:hypothetical protein
VALLDNIDIAILTRVNDLAELHGFKPYEFVATVRDLPEACKMRLAYEVPASGTADKEKRFYKMVDAIGAGEKTGILEGTAAEIIDAIDNAIARAPKPRSR